MLPLTRVTTLTLSVAHQNSLFTVNHVACHSVAAEATLSPSLHALSRSAVGVEVRVQVRLGARKASRSIKNIIFLVVRDFRGGGGGGGFKGRVREVSAGFRKLAAHTRTRNATSPPPLPTHSHISHLFLSWVGRSLLSFVVCACCAFVFVRCACHVERRSRISSEAVVR